MVLEEGVCRCSTVAALLLLLSCCCSPVAALLSLLYCCCPTVAALLLLLYCVLPNKKQLPSAISFRNQTISQSQSPPSMDPLQPEPNLCLAKPSLQSPKLHVTMPRNKLSQALSPTANQPGPFPIPKPGRPSCLMLPKNPDTPVSASVMRPCRLASTRVVLQFGCKTSPLVSHVGCFSCSMRGVLL
jgi:hypothetical protein